MCFGNGEIMLHGVQTAGGNGNYHKIRFFKNPFREGAFLELDRVATGLIETPAGGMHQIERVRIFVDERHV